MLKELSQKYKRFIRFSIVGTIAWVILYAVYYLFLSLLGHTASYTIGYIVSFIVNYLLTVKFTFEVEASAQNGIGFIFCHVINWLLQLVLLNIFIYLGMNNIIAPIPVMAISVPVNFLMVRFVMNKFPLKGKEKGIFTQRSQ